jgi:hypothetical protein
LHIFTAEDSIALSPTGFTLSRTSGMASRQQSQLIFRDSKFCGATIQAHQKLWKYPDNGRLHIFRVGDMHSDLSIEMTKLFRTA